MSANKTFVLGLTGGIGCGKSAAAQYLASLGAAHIDADAISRALTAPGGAALPEIRKAFGDGVFMPDGTLNRAALAQIVFADDAQRAELNRWVAAKHFDRGAKIAAVTRIYNEIGIDRLASEKIRHYFDGSRQYLAAVRATDERKAELAAYAQRMMRRNY